MSELTTDADTATAADSAADAGASTTSDDTLLGGDATGGASDDTKQNPDGGTDQAAADDGADTGSDDADDKGSDGAPEQYEFTAPEGQEFDPEALEAFSGVARELNLTQDGAQKILETMGTVMSERRDSTVQGWADATKADKALGGDKLDASLATAKTALDRFGSPELRALLNETGLGNHPEVVRAFVKVGEQISEDGFVGAGGSPAENKTLAQRMYPNMNP